MSTLQLDAVRTMSIKNALAYSLLTARLMLTPKILGIFSILFFFFAFCFFLVQVPKVPESTCIGCVGQRGCNQACMFYYRF